MPATSTLHSLRGTGGRRLLLVTAALLAALFVGCKPEVGDSCKLSTDCSILGDRLCDTSQPDGYCTIFNCEPGSCPSESVCVEFHGASERFARRFCVRSCDGHSDCRPGYICLRMPRVDRDARILDPDPDSSNVCLP